MTKINTAATNHSVGESENEASTRPAHPTANAASRCSAARSDARPVMAGAMATVNQANAASAGAPRAEMAPVQPAVHACAAAK